MLPSRIRMVSLTAVLLVAMLAMSVARSVTTFVHVDAQEPAKPEKTGVKLKQLQNERLATAEEVRKLIAQRVKNNEGTIDELIEATRLVYDAALDLADTDKERVAFLENYLGRAQDNERIALRASKSGQGRESSALKAKAERLRIEIALERMKARNDAPQKGVAVNPGSTEPVKVKNVQPKNGDQQRVCVQRASIQAYESIGLYAQVAGFLKSQTVDIGDRVKRGQVLAVVDVPELEAQVKQKRVVVDQALSRVMQAKARVAVAKADLDTAKGAVVQAEATTKSAAASVKFREKQWQRMKELFAVKSIEERILDESKERYDASIEAELAANAAIATAKAQLSAGEARIAAAQADVAGAEADVLLARTELDLAQEKRSTTTIVAPFDGVITHRGYFPGDFIRSANSNANHEPLFTLQRIDRMRVVVLIPERDIPFVDVGNTATLEIDALPGKKWSIKVSRTAFAEDPKTHCMRVELDLPNPTDQLRHGMSGSVTIVLTQQKE